MAVAVSVSRRQIGDILANVLSDVAHAHSTKRAPSVLAIGVTVWADSISVPHVELLHQKLPAAVKSSFTDLAQTVFKDPERSGQLRRRGDLRLDLREHQELPHELPLARYFFAHDKRRRVPTLSDDLDVRIRSWAITAQAPKTPFSPLVLRTAEERVEGSIAAALGTPSAALFEHVLSCGAVAEGLAILCALHRLDGAALWQYDEVGRRFSSVATSGISGAGILRVPISHEDDNPRRGIVSLTSPDRKPVIYDAEDPDSWQPPAHGSWEPFDHTLFSGRRWRSSVVVPIVFAGRLIGALSVYSTRPAKVITSLISELEHAADVAASAILVQRDQATLADLARKYDEELITANVGLGALSLSHDVLHYYLSVKSALEQIDGYLTTGQLQEAAQHLRFAQDAMARTEPVLHAMRRLATEARTDASGRTSELTNAGDLIHELEPLLRAILPQFSKSGRLSADGIHTAVVGRPRQVPMSPIALERIVVNLCVNSAQWRASEVNVTAHFDRSDSEMQLVVRDNGVGIPAAEISRVFDRFYSRRRGGSGLGLYVVRSIVSRAGGDVHVQSFDRQDSREPRGTVITVVLPTVPPDAGG